MDCNRGQCIVTQEPSCFCSTSDQFWYTGNRCQTAISKPGVYAGVSVGVVVLLITIGILSVLTCTGAEEIQAKQA
ncbi:hypothetical protein GDO86_018941 [Hymenochirus boettgeri]|uniref:Uncharacterized protein n=1 Tax=Hymenochirus boettgeri TaxID=247094 RepID=A0A8T2IHP9_9PIPI|nr:hypothetical protein GDO86_018941 [Hymenochirus boettgeri]